MRQELIEWPLQNDEENLRADEIKNIKKNTHTEKALRILKCVWCVCA